MNVQLGSPRFLPSPLCSLEAAGRAEISGDDVCKEEEGERCAADVPGHKRRRRGHRREDFFSVPSRQRAGLRRSGGG